MPGSTYSAAERIVSRNPRPKRRSRMSRFSFLPIVLVAAVTSTSPAAIAADTPLDVTVSRAPIAPDGTTTGAVTDFVLTFADRDPSVDGLGLPTGSTITVDLPAAFVNTGAGGDNAIILQGWPQSPIVPFPYTLDVNGNQVTLTSDFMPGSDGEGGPVPKQVRLFLSGFVNPPPGMADVSPSPPTARSRARARARPRTARSGYRAGVRSRGTPLPWCTPCGAPPRAPRAR